MPRADSRRARWLAFFITVPVVVAADQITKALIRAYPVGSVIFSEGILRIVRVENSGAAFGLFQRHSSTLLVVDLLVMVAVLSYLLFFTGRFPLFRNVAGWFAIALIFAGASGNVIDRLNPRVSGITDFIYVWKWPAFNVADSAIVVGTILLVISVLFSMETPRASE